MKIFTPPRGTTDAPVTIRLGLLGVLASTALIAACASQPVAQSAQQSANGESDVVCRDVVVAGFQHSERVCHTRKEWSQIDYAAFQRTRPTFPSPNGNSPSSDVGVQPWAPQMPVPSAPPPVH
jgi:hypothetical protein